MTTEVIILAQGTQKRLGMRYGYKQLLRLPECGGVPILQRTLCQISHIHPDALITLVGWKPVTDPMVALAFPFGVQAVELEDPGNSSLKGIARYLEARGARHGFHHTIVLLGDVVYSWACLEAIWRMSAAYGFVGTSNLSEGGGELWGVAWAKGHEDTVMSDLRDALLRHPIEDQEYQPGQLRRWLLGWRKGSLQARVTKMRDAGVYYGVDDYTMDVDLPYHIPALGPTSKMAVVDDAKHRLFWDGGDKAP